MRNKYIKLRIFYSAITVALLCPPHAEASDDCRPLKALTSVELHIGADDGRPYIPVEIAGKPKSVLVDTGGFMPEISNASATELQMNKRDVSIEVVGVTGETSHVAAKSSLKIGNLTANSVEFIVMPGEPDLSQNISDAVGIIGPTILGAYDADFDFGNGKFNLMSQDHCEGKVVYWPASAVAMVPIHIAKSGHIIVDVTLDGKVIQALLDTGASDSVLNLNTAEETFGLKPGSPDMPESGELKPGAKAYSHRFQSLSLEGITVSNPRFTVIPDLMRGRMTDWSESNSDDSRIHSTGEAEGLGDMILGMNILKALHVYIAYKEQRLYITAAAPQSATATTAH